MSEVQQSPNSEKNGLAVRLPNWVGDVVMAVPTLKQLLRSGFALHAIGRGWARDLLAALPIELHPLQRGIWSQSRSLRQMPPRNGLLFPNSLSSAASMWLGGVRAVGYRGDGRTLLLRKALARPKNLHEVEYFWHLGAAVHRLWGDPAIDWPATPPDSMGLPVAENQRGIARKTLAAHDVVSPYIVCCPLAVGTTQGVSRIWPHFAELCKALIADGRQVVACPGPGEEGLCDQSLPGATIVPKLSLGGYAAVMQGAQFVIANNSGPMHIAAAVGAPVLGIFGVGDVARTRPWGGNYVGGSGHWPDLAEVWNAVQGLSADRLRTAG